MDIDEWKVLLGVEDHDFFSISTNLDLSNQRVISSDVDRTRTGVLTPYEKTQLELILTYYCKECNTSYMQGMNELVAPFLLMSRNGLPLHSVYLYFKAFLHKFLPTMFADQHFKPLQALFLLFRLILRYFDPRLSTFFLVNNIEPQSFVTSWLLTLFAGKINNLSNLYYLWKEILIEKDLMFPLFLSISIVLHNKDKIVQCQDRMVPQIISQIHLDELDELKQIISVAKGLKEKLPYSILLQISKAGVFNLERIESLIGYLETQSCLSIMPCEVVHRAYPEVSICPCKDKNCPWKTGRGHSIPLVVIDCRTQSEQDSGIFPNSVLLNQRAYEDSEYMLNFPDQFMPMRNLFHFCFMGSQAYKGFNFDLTILNQGQDDVVQNMVENLLQVFLMKGFSHLSVLDGGFQECHDLAFGLGLNIENHNKNLCERCSNVEKNEHKEEIRERRPSKECLSLRSDDFRHEKAGFYKELQDSHQKLGENKEKFIFLCKKFEEEQAANEEYLINIGSTWLGVSLVTSELVQEILRVRISGLVKLTFIKKNPRILSFRFSEQSEDLSFIMKTVEEAKLCANQITKYFQMSLNFL